MDPFNADLSEISCLVLILLVVGVNMLALAWRDLACDLVEKTGGQQEGGDDDLKEVICVT